MTKQQRKEGSMNVLRCLCLLAGLTAVSAQADSVVVNVTGQIVPASCTVLPFPAVNLGDIKDTDMATVGSASQPVAFSLQLTGCPTTTKNVTALFSGAADTMDSNLYKITQGAGYASGLGVRLTDVDHGNLVLKPGTPGGSSQVAVDGGQNATFNLKAQAVTTQASPVAGDIAASVTVTFTYQ